MSEEEFVECWDCNKKIESDKAEMFGWIKEIDQYDGEELVSWFCPECW